MSGGDLGAPLSIDEYGLAGFFGCLPIERDAGEPWEYNDCVYEFAHLGVSVSFAIAPAYRDVRILVNAGSATVLEFEAMGVQDVRVHSEKGRESLEVRVTPAHALWLTLKPQVTLRQSVSGDERQCGLA